VASRGTWVRAHAIGLGPWWFATAQPSDRESGGRFDLDSPEGTCYVARTVETAVREKVGHLGLSHRNLPAALLDTIAVAQLSPRHRPDRGPNVHLFHEDAVGLVTRETSTDDSYARSQEWARAFRRDGWAGIRYLPRFDPSPNGVAEAWFGPMGAHSLPATPVQDWRARLPNRPVRHLSSRHVRVIDPAAGGIP